MSSFICPHCKANLNVCDHIVFGAEKKNGDKGLILLNQELGNYNATFHENFKPEEGEKVEFHCPACHKSLTSEKADDLAKVQMIDKEGNSFEIHFSKIKGEKSTYKIEGESMDLYGDHSKRYINYFNLSMMT